ncbi:MAG: type III secretion system chaperone [Chlamydiia bacterium]
MQQGEYEALIRQFVEYLGVEKPESVVPNVVALPMNDGLILEIAHIHENVLLMVITEERLKVNRAEALEALMVGNLVGKDTRGSVLGLREGDQLVVHKWLYGEWIFQSFRDEVEDILNIASAWVESLKSIATT